MSAGARADEEVDENVRSFCVTKSESDGDGGGDIESGRVGKRQNHGSEREGPWVWDSCLAAGCSRSELFVSDSQISVWNAGL